MATLEEELYTVPRLYNKLVYGAQFLKKTKEGDVTCVKVNNGYYEISGTDLRLHPHRELDNAEVMTDSIACEISSQLASDTGSVSFM